MLHPRGVLYDLERMLFHWVLFIVQYLFIDEVLEDYEKGFFLRLSKEMSTILFQSINSALNKAACMDKTGLPGSLSSGTLIFFLLKIPLGQDQY